MSTNALQSVRTVVRFAFYTGCVLVVAYAVYTVLALVSAVMMGPVDTVAGDDDLDAVSLSNADGIKVVVYLNRTSSEYGFTWETTSPELIEQSVVHPVRHSTVDSHPARYEAAADMVIHYSDGKTQSVAIFAGWKNFETDQGYRIGDLTPLQRRIRADLGDLGERMSDGF